MSPAEMTYQQVIASPDMAREVRGLSDAELIQLRRWLAGGGSRAEVAKTVHGLCIVVEGERFEERTTDGHGSARMEELVIKINVDFCHGSEVRQ